MKKTIKSRSRRHVFLSLAGIVASIIFASCQTMNSKTPPRTLADPLDRAELEDRYTESVEENLYFWEQPSSWNPVPMTR